jgi:hypothetical protein
MEANKLKVISGFQTGADIAGIKAARDNNIETGGYIPKGCITEKGNKPQYKELYGAEETSSTNYLGRTLKNVMKADCTIIFDYMQSSGSKNTKTFCANNNKSFMYLNSKDIDSNDIVEAILLFIKLHNPSIINIAGNRESVSKGIENKVYNILNQVFNKLNERIIQV